MRPRKMRLAVRGLRHWTGAMRTSENAVEAKFAEFPTIAKFTGMLIYPIAPVLSEVGL
jgi:hypothetical protein